MNLIWQEVFLRPIFNLLIFFYNVIPPHDLGIAIILLTAVIKIILVPTSLKMAKSQKELAALQKEINKIKEKYKNDFQKQNEELMKLYREKGINPFASCLPLLIQMPFFIALFVVLKDIGQNHLNFYYSFITPPSQINTVFLGLIDLAKPDKFVLPLLAALSQFVYSHLLANFQQGKEQGTKTVSQQMNRQINIIFAVMIFFLAQKFPGGLPLYWAANSVFSILLHLFVERRVLEKS